MTLAEEVARYEALTERMVGRYRAKMVSMCRANDLTPTQFWAMHTLAELGSVKMSPLADALGLSMGAASTLVERLVTRELVQRRSDPDDRRAVFVQLTEKGRAVLGEAVGAKRELMQRVFARLSEADRERLLAGLEALVLVWESLPAEEFGANA